MDSAKSKSLNSENVSFFSPNPYEPPSEPNNKNNEINIKDATFKDNDDKDEKSIIIATKKKVFKVVAENNPSEIFEEKNLYVEKLICIYEENLSQREIAGIARLQNGDIIIGVNERNEGKGIIYRYNNQNEQWEEERDKKDESKIMQTPNSSDSSIIMQISKISDGSICVLRDKRLTLYTFNRQFNRDFINYDNSDIELQLSSFHEIKGGKLLIFSEKDKKAFPLSINPNGSDNFVIEGNFLKGKGVELIMKIIKNKDSYALKSYLKKLFGNKVEENSDLKRIGSSLKKYLKNDLRDRVEGSSLKEDIKNYLRDKVEGSNSLKELLLIFIYFASASASASVSDLKFNSDLQKKLKELEEKLEETELAQQNPE